MNPTAIVYTSNTGFTQQYAALLAEETALSAYPLKNAKKALPAGTPVIYLGWLMAGQVKGYSEAKKHFSVQCVCGVGMGTSGSQLDDVRKASSIPDTTPLFTLQGGYDSTRLRGIYKLMMTVMTKTLGKQMAEKPQRTPEEEEMLDLLLHGGNKVCRENLNTVLEWVNCQ